MANETRVLVVVDPTGGVHPCVERAAWLAQHTPTRIELYISDYAPQVADPRSHGAAAVAAKAAVLERHRKRLEELAAPLRANGLTVDIDARWDHPLHDSIVRKAEESDADIVIKDTHFHSVLKRAIFSNTDWSLIRSCASTLWLVKPGQPQQQPRFIAAVDPLHQYDKPAHLDRRILATAHDLGRSLNGEVHVFHAFDVPPVITASSDPLSMPIAVPVDALSDALRAQHTEAVAALCKPLGVPAERIHVRQGGTREQLLSLAEKLHADAVVMGAVSRSGLKGLFLGNTAEDVLDRLSCDLIIVKPEGFKAIRSS